MPKITDYKAYFKDIATKAGLKDDVIQQVIGSDETFKAFTDGFVPMSNYHSELDNVKNTTKTETEKATAAAKDAEYADWHEKEKVKFNEYVAGLDKLKKYEDVFGPLDVTNPPDPNANANRNRGGNGNAMTQEEIDKLVEAKTQAILNDTLARRDSAVMDLLEARESHMSNFKTSLNVKEFEAAWKEHPEWGGSLKMAYDKFVEPKVREAETKTWEAKLAAAREEGIRDGYSRRSLPTDNGNTEFSPMFHRKEDVAKLGDREQEDHSRNAFFEGLRDANKQPA